MINQNDANAELISKLGYKTVAVIHDTTDYGKGHNEYFSKALARIGKAKIVGTFGVTAEQQDFTAELTKIKALNPDVIYFGDAIGRIQQYATESVEVNSGDVQIKK